MWPICGSERSVRKNADDGNEAGSYPKEFEAGPRVIDIEFPMLSLGSDRAQQLSDNGTSTQLTGMY